MEEYGISLQRCIDEKEELRSRLMEAYEAIQAIRSDTVDGLVFDVVNPASHIVSLHGADESYRIFLQEMNEGAATITRDGLIVFSNNRFAKMVKTPLEAVIGNFFQDLIRMQDRDAFISLLSASAEESGCGEFMLSATDGSFVPAYLSLNRASVENLENYYFIVATDLSERKRNEQILASERLARSILENASEAIVVCDGNGRVMRANHMAIDLCQGDPNGLLFEDAFLFYASDGALYKLVDSTRTMSKQEVHALRNGRRIDLLINVGILLNQGNQSIGHVITLTDVTQVKVLMEDLAKEKTLFETTLESVGDGVISCNTKGTVMLINRKGEELTGWMQQEAKDRSVDEVFYLTNLKTKQRIENIVERIVVSKQSSELTNQAILISKAGFEIPIEYNVSPILHSGDEISGVVIVLRDITEKMLKEKEIEYLSFFDKLTGLYNRRYYEEELSRLDTERNLPIAMIMADVNGLKMINDAFGHIVGDELLQKSAMIIKKECRSDDIIARIGGDEFVILLPKTDESGADVLINRINARLADEQLGALNLSVSFGCGVKRSVEENIKNIFIDAENKMYRHKLSESASMRSKNIDLIINSLYEKSHREMLHSKRVSNLCEKLAVSLCFGKDGVNQMKTAGLMHDIGKIGIEDRILNKEGKLSEDEWSAMLRHPEIGYRILSSVNELSELADYILFHHERWDGKGYPREIKGELIPMQSRIIALADAYDAMTTDRTYRSAMSREEAISEIERCAGTQFDPVIAKIFIETVI